MAQTFKEHYTETLVPQLMKELALTNIMQVPKLVKITINMGVGEAINDKKIIQHALKDMASIAGQKGLLRLAKKSEAGFKLREGFPVGCKVVLRRERMYSFLERLLFIALPRVRDFRGLSPKSFDGRGNYSLGIREQIVFPEIDYEKIDALRGMDITITTSARTNKEGLALLKAFKFPLRER